jgi:GNAT superfamily N-acetyltransferase
MVEEVKIGKSDICKRVLDDLPEWFGLEDAKAKYVADVAALPMFVVKQASEVVGFVSLKQHNEFTAELYVIGVKRKWHGKGVGTRLVEAVIGLASRKKLQFLTVKTIAATNADPNYAMTRRFYERNGFVPLEVFPTLWMLSNPCLFMARTVPPISMKT